MKSRNLGISLLVLLVVTLAVAVPAFAQDLPKSIDVNISTSDGGDWYKNPIVIGGGVILLFLLVALASRGGTTVVKS